MRELLEMVALDIQPGATAVLVCRYQTFPNHDQDLLEKYKSEVSIYNDAFADLRTHLRMKIANACEEICEIVLDLRMRAGSANLRWQVTGDTTDETSARMEGLPSFHELRIITHHGHEIFHR